jgi:putative flavoprotein involved in K+ transport
MIQDVETLIIGGGQAGLSTSYYLQQFGREHVILEAAAQPAHAWRENRWDSFNLLTPNWSFRLPGAEYQGDDPHGFMGRGEIVATFEEYIDRFQLPVQFGERVDSVEANTDGPGYVVITPGRRFRARNVVVATSLYQRARKPLWSSDLSPYLTQLHAIQYRNPGVLPPGAVLVVGSAQSGCQIAEELYQSGRQVYLCTSSAGRAPRRYRGKDIFEWLQLSGFQDRTVHNLPSPKVKFAANPHLSGRDGGRTINLHQFARDGVMLLGRIQDGRDSSVKTTSDLKENLAKADQFEAELVKLVDDYVAMAGLEAPTEHLPVLKDGFEVQEITELDLRRCGVTSIVWAMGFTFNFNLVKLPIFDHDGYPIQQRGVTAYPGLSFVGLPWLYKNKSGLLVGVGEDAEYIASRIVSNEAHNPDT